MNAYRVMHIIIGDGAGLMWHYGYPVQTRIWTITRIGKWHLVRLVLKNKISRQ